jgi:threonine synthase
MLALFDSDQDVMRSRVSGCAVSDEETRTAIRDVAAAHHYILDPHGAVGWCAARQWQGTHPQAATVVLETAHPAKFPEVIDSVLGTGRVVIPERLACLASKEKSALAMAAEVPAFIDWLRTLE